MIKKSTMLGLIFFSSLFYSADSHARSKQKIDITDYVSANCTDQLSEGDLCKDSKGRVAVVTGERGRNWIPGKRAEGGNKIHRLSDKELRAYLKGRKDVDASGDTQVCNDGKDCVTVRICSDGSSSCNADGTPKGNGNAGGSGGGNGGGTVVAADDGGGKTKYVVVDGRGKGRKNRRGRGGDIYIDTISDIAADYDFLVSWCHDLPDLIEDRDTDIKNAQANLDDINAQIKDQQKAVDDAFAKAKDSCRMQCLNYAVTTGSKCAMTADEFQYACNSTDMASDKDLQDKYNAFFTDPKVVAKHVAFKTAHPNATKNACDTIAKKSGCAEELAKEDGSFVNMCADGDAWLKALAALNDLKADQKDAIAALDGYKKNSSKTCKVISASDARKKHWDSCDADCLQSALDSCDGAIKQAQLDLNSARGGYCPDCGAYGNGDNSCMLYGNCGVSKAAQIIAAAGGIVTPVALGLMNMSMHNKSLAACTSMYAQQIQLSQTVGLPPTAAGCGGMGGMGGGFMPGYNPMGMGMGMGMGGMPGMFPGMGMGFGMGMGMPGMGMGGMYPGMGMGGMGGMYPGMGGMGGMYPGMGLGLNVGFGLGLGGMGGMGYPGMGGMGYPGMGGMGGMGFPGFGGGMYYPGMGGMGGMGYPGMGGMGGMGNPYMNGQMNIQNQMYNSQLQMQQAAYQQIALQNSMMYGYNNGANMYGGAGGAGMYGSPYFGMGGGMGGGMYPGMGYGGMGGGMYPGMGYGGYGGGYPGLGVGGYFNAGIGFY